MFPNHVGPLCLRVSNVVNNICLIILLQDTLVGEVYTNYSIIIIIVTVKSSKYLYSKNHRYQLISIDSFVEIIFSACVEVFLKCLLPPIITDNSLYNIIYMLPRPLQEGSGFVARNLP